MGKRSGKATSINGGNIASNARPYPARNTRSQTSLLDEKMDLTKGSDANENDVRKDEAKQPSLKETPDDTEDESTDSSSEESSEDDSVFGRRGSKVGSIVSSLENKAEGSISSRQGKRKRAKDSAEKAKQLKKQKETTSPKTENDPGAEDEDDLKLRMVKALEGNEKDSKRNREESRKMRKALRKIHGIDWTKLREDIGKVPTIEKDVLTVGTKVEDLTKAVARLEENTMKREDVEVLVKDLFAKEKESKPRTPSKPGLSAGKQARMSWAARTNMAHFPPLQRENGRSPNLPLRRAVGPKAKPKKQHEKDYEKLYELTVQEVVRDGVDITIRYEVPEKDVVSLTSMALMVRNIPMTSTEGSRSGKEAMAEGCLRRLKDLTEKVTMEDIDTVRRMNPPRPGLRQGREGPEPVVVYFKDAQKVKDLKEIIFKSPQTFRDIRVYAERECKKHAEFMKMEVKRLEKAEDFRWHWIEWNRDNNLALRIVSETMKDAEGNTFSDPRILDNQSEETNDNLTLTKNKPDEDMITEPGTGIPNLTNPPAQNPKLAPEAPQ